MNDILKTQKQIRFFLDPEKKKLESNAVIKSHLSTLTTVKLIQRIYKKPVRTVHDDMMIQDTA